MSWRDAPFAKTRPAQHPADAAVRKWRCCSGQTGPVPRRSSLALSSDHPPHGHAAWWKGQQHMLTSATSGKTMNSAQPGAEFLNLANIFSNQHPRCMLIGFEDK